MRQSFIEGGNPGTTDDSTRVTLLSPAGRGALAVVGVAGNRAVELVARLFVAQGQQPFQDRSVAAICFGRWIASGEQLIVVRGMAGSGSAALPTVEVHCHGGTAAAEAVLTSLESLGAVRQLWPAWLSGSGASEIEVEARRALAQAGGPQAAQIVSRQLAGSLQRELDRIASLLAKADECPQQRAEAIAAIDRVKRAAGVGLRLTRPWRVVVAVAVNAGKSSLVNAVGGFSRSIVSAEPGTSRDLLDTRLVIGGWEIDLVDTAGLREGRDYQDTVRESAGSVTIPATQATNAVEHEGIARAMAARASADLVLWVVDGRHAQPVGHCAANEVLICSKADLVERNNTDPWPLDTVWTSARTGHGIADLTSIIIRRLVPQEEDEPSLLLGAVPFTARQLAIVESLYPSAPLRSSPTAHEAQ